MAGGAIDQVDWNEHSGVDGRAIVSSERDLINETLAVCISLILGSRVFPT